MARDYTMEDSINSADDMYREVLLEHYRNPQNKHELKDADIRKYDHNPMCGDEVEMFAKVDSDKNVQKLSFTGHGCVICMASASMLTEELNGKGIDEIGKMGTDDILKMMNLKLTPTRIKCAMLPLIALKKGMIEYRGKNE